MTGQLHPAERIAEFSAAGWWTHDTWESLLREHVQTRPDATAVVDAPNRASFMDGDGARLRWAELDAKVAAVAGALLGVGVGAGDVVAMQLPNSVELVTTLLAVARLGAVVTPFPVQYREFELEQLATLVAAKVFVTATRVVDRAGAEVAKSLVAAVPSLESVAAFGPLEALPAGVVALDGASGSTASPVDLDPAAAVTVCWTSGTEATPKGVPRCAHDWVAIARASVDGVGMTAGDVLLNPFPMVNMAGIGGMFVPWLLSGATLVQHHPFDLGTFVEQIARERVTYTVAPPALLNMLLAMPDVLARADLSSLRIIGSGSAPLSPEMVKGWKHGYGIDVTNFFGSNEGVALLGDPGTIPDPELRARFFPRAHRIAGMRTKLVDLVTGDEITQPGVPGELCVAGPTVIAGYLGGAGSDAFDADGFFHTGDVFELAEDADGTPCFYRFVDRVKDLVIRGGMNISPAEIEALVVSHPKVAEVAVVGLPDATLGERAAAVVVAADPADPPTLEDIVEHLRTKHIASYKLPEHLEVVAALPRNPVGKVLKRELRDQFTRVAP